MDLHSLCGNKGRCLKALFLAFTCFSLSGCLSFFQSTFGEVRRGEPATIAESPVLLRAIRLRDWATAESLVAAGKGLSESARGNITPVRLAAKGGRESLVKALVASGSVKELDGELAMIEAAAAGHEGIVSFLIQQGYRAGSKEGYAAITETRNAEALRLLLRAPAPSYKIAAKSISSTGSIAVWVAAYGDDTLMAEVLSRGADPNASTDKIGVSASYALHLAAKAGRTECVRLLLNAGAKPDSKDIPGFTPLMRACEEGHLETARLLLDKGADPNAISYSSYTVSSAITSYVDMSSVDLVARVTQRTPLMLAAESGSPELVRLLLARGAKPDTLDNRKRSALDIARTLGNTRCADALLEHGASGSGGRAEPALITAIWKADSAGVGASLDSLPAVYTQKGAHKPLRAAVSALIAAELAAGTEGTALRDRAATVLDMLIARIDELSVEDKSDALNDVKDYPSIQERLFDGGIRGDATSTGIAAEYFAGRGDRQRFLKAFGEVKGALSKSKLNWVLYYAALGGDTSIIDAVLDAGANVNAGSREDFVMSPMAWSASEGKLDAVKHFATRGGIINPKLADAIVIGGRPVFSPLMAAAIKGKTKIARYLIGAGADIGALSYPGPTSLGLAAEYGQTEVVKLLLEAGADPNERYKILASISQGIYDMRGETPLMRAAREGRTETVKVLLASGADPRLTDWNGDDVLLIAIDAGHADVERILRVALGDLYR